MELTYEQALQVQRNHESALLELAAVSGVGVKQRQGRLALVVDVDPVQELPSALRHHEIDGLPLVVERGRYSLQTAAVPSPGADGMQPKPHVGADRFAG